MRATSDALSIPMALHAATTTADRPSLAPPPAQPRPSPAARPIARPVAPPFAGSTDTVAFIRGLVSDVPGVYALTARGHSMRDALVSDGDLVLVQPDANIRDGELAAVGVNGHRDVILRRVYFEGDQVRLQPENRRLHPVVLDRRQVRIQGRVIAIARQNPLAPAGRRVPAIDMPPPDA